MGWYPSTYPAEPFFIAAHFYRDACDFMRRLELHPKPPQDGLPLRTYQSRIDLINLSIARCMSVLWNLSPIQNADVDRLPAALIYDGSNASGVRTVLFMEFCRQLRDTRLKEYAGGIWEYDLAAEFRDKDMDDPACRKERDRIATERASACITADAYHYLHNADEFDLMIGFGGYGQWEGGTTEVKLPAAFEGLPWNTPSLVSLE